MDGWMFTEMTDDFDGFCTTLFFARRGVSKVCVLGMRAEGPSDGP